MNICSWILVLYKLAEVISVQRNFLLGNIWLFRKSSGFMLMIFGLCWLSDRHRQGEGRMSDRHTFASSVATDFYQQGHVFHLAWPRRSLNLNTTASPKRCYAKPIFVWFCCCICVSYTWEVFGVRVCVGFYLPAFPSSKQPKEGALLALEDVWIQHQVTLLVYSISCSLAFFSLEDSNIFWIIINLHEEFWYVIDVIEFYPNWIWQLSCRTKSCHITW